MDGDSKGVVTQQQGIGDAGRGHPARLEQAARAAWLYYVGRCTQDEIAAQLNISRQTAQRLVSLAVAEKLIKFRFDHPIGPCMELGRALSDRYGLGFCDVVPRAGEADGIVAAIAVAGAQYLERWFTQRPPLVLGLATGRTLRAIVNELSPVDAPQHKIIALCGTMLPAGRAISSDPVMRIAERTGAQCFPMPTPVIASSIEEKRLLQAQRPFATLHELLQQARCLMVGIGHIGWQAPLHHDGFVSDAELTELIEAGAVGEIAGWSFDQHGRLLDCSINDRVAGLRPTENETAMRVGVAGGPQKVAAIRAALAGRLITGLITDEVTARALLRTNASA